MGEDGAAASLRRLAGEIARLRLVPTIVPARPTTVKTRFVAGTAIVSRADLEAALAARRRDASGAKILDQPAARAQREAWRDEGADHRAEEIVGGPEVRARGGEVLIADLLPGHATSRTVERIASATRGDKPAR